MRVPCAWVYLNLLNFIDQNPRIFRATQKKELRILNETHAEMYSISKLL